MPASREHVVGNVKITCMPEGDLAAAAGVPKVKKGRVAGWLISAVTVTSAGKLHLHHLNAVLKRPALLSGYRPSE